jgi:hypothetical protein
VRGQGADADDAGLDGAAEAVGVGEQSGLGRGRGCDLRGPEAGGDPERGDGKEREAEGAAEGKERERREGDGGEEEGEGRARGCGREFGEGFAEGETEGGGEQRCAAEAKRLDARGSRPEAALAFRFGFGSGNTRGLPQQATRLSRQSLQIGGVVDSFICGIFWEHMNCRLGSRRRDTRLGEGLGLTPGAGLSMIKPGCMCCRTQG